MRITDQNRSVLLGNSKFGSHFKLDEKDRIYISRVGVDKVRAHAHDFIQKRLAPAQPKNDGRQTPFQGHPIFSARGRIRPTFYGGKAQHATSICCRGCLEKWYGIPKGQVLKTEEIEKLADILMAWIESHFACRENHL